MSSFSAIESYPDVEYLNSAAEKIINNIIIGLALQKEKIIFGLCGGRSVAGIFQLLAKNTAIPWSKVHFFMVDERLVSIDNHESNYGIAEENLLNPLKEKGLIAAENCHPYLLDRNSPDYGIGAYSEELEAFGGKFDLALLSAGEDGHVAALYPNHPSIEDNSEFYIYMNNSPKPPPERMTASRRLMLRTQTAILLVMGEEKAEAYKNLMDVAVEVKDCPAKLVTQIPASYLITTHKP